MGSQSDIEKAYIAGFLDGDGSIMLQLKKRADTTRGYRFMATICLYQDTRHDAHLYWVQEVLGVGYVSKRSDNITELRINGFSTVRRILEDLQPFIRFKALQTEAMITACRILDTRINMLSKKQLLGLVELMLAIQQENYSAHRKKTREELYEILDLTP